MELHVELHLQNIFEAIIYHWLLQKQRLKVRVWSDTCYGYDQGDEVAEWLSSFLGEQGLRLVRIDEKERRQVDRDYAKTGQITGQSLIERSDTDSN